MQHVVAESAGIDAQRQYYTERWDRFQYANSLEAARIGKTIDLIAEVDMAKYPAICDLGCGAGWSTNILGTFGEATGVDLSDVSVAQTRYPHCRFISTNIMEWNPPGPGFDAVVSLEVLEHIEKADQVKFIGVARRILKTDGYFILTTPNRRTMEAMPGGGLSWSNQPLENWVDAAELKSLMRQNGFEVKQMTSIILGEGRAGSYRVMNSVKVNSVAQFLGLERAWHWLARETNYGLHLVVLAQKK